MKNSRLLIVGLGAVCCSFLFSGCTTTAGALEAASTKFEVHSGKNKSMTIVLPKELDTTGLHLDIDPASGHIKLDTEKLKSSSQALIESAGAAQAQSIAAMSKTIGDLVPMLAKLAAAAIAPQGAAAAAVVSAVDTVAAPADPAPAPAVTFTPVDPATVSAAAK